MFLSSRFFCSSGWRHSEAVDSLIDCAGGSPTAGCMNLGQIETKRIELQEQWVYILDFLFGHRPLALKQALKLRAPSSGH
jgi:hypothetical protein